MQTITINPDVVCALYMSKVTFSATIKRRMTVFDIAQSYGVHPWYIKRILYDRGYLRMYPIKPSDLKRQEAFVKVVCSRTQPST